MPREVKTLKIASPIENKIMPIPTIKSGKAFLSFSMIFA